MALNLNIKTSMIHIAPLEIKAKTINLLDKIIILIEYLNFTNIFLA